MHKKSLLPCLAAALLCSLLPASVQAQLPDGSAKETVQTACVAWNASKTAMPRPARVSLFCYGVTAVMNVPQLAKGTKGACSVGIISLPIQILPLSSETAKE